MSGIVGTLVFKDSDFVVTPPYLTVMRDTLSHRGPDEAGLWISDDKKVGFGHRRLSVIDLSMAASQPMTNRSGSLCITYNGAVFNHAEIRAELNRLGPRRWKTEGSDTEVILQAYAQWGISCLERFRGMFAFGLWDSRSRELWLVRDRMGIKPLSYSVHNGRLTFASEIKALLKDPDQKRIVNEEALYHYLTFLATPVPSSMFEGIKKLPAGCLLRVTENGGVEMRRYWDVLDHMETLEGLSDADIAARILECLRESVAIQNTSDAPVGVFLSGGIDSSTNAALLAEAQDARIKTFCIGYDGDYDPDGKLGAKGASYRNETQFARSVAAEINSAHFERLLTSDQLIGFLPEMLRFLDEPIADPGCAPLYFLSALARDNGVVVCQSGEGADALFVGTRGARRLIRLQHLNDWPVPAGLKRLGLFGLDAMGGRERFPYERLRRAAAGQAVYWSGGELFTDAEKMAVLSPRLSRTFDKFTSWEAIQPIRKRFEEKASHREPLLWMNYVDMNLRFPEWLLTRLDRMTMAAGIECRVPFLDHEFVTLVLGVPEAVKIRGNTLKYILKYAVRGLIPDEIIDRPKQGLGAPIYEWFLGGLGDLARQELESFCRQTDFLDSAQVMRLIEEQPTKPVPRTRQIWALLNLALWWRVYMSK